MTGQLIAALRQIAKAVIPSYIFEYDEASTMNLKADAIENDKAVFWIDEARRGRYRLPQSADQGYFRRKETYLQLYFMRFSKELEPFTSIGDSHLSVVAAQTLADTRQAIRDRIESEAVIPYIEALDKERSGVLRGFSFGDINWVYPIRPRFDSNEVAVMLEITILEQNTCLSSLK